jgi:hypothetical protein
MIELQWRQDGQDGKKRYGIAFDENSKLEDGTWDFDLVARTAHYRCQCCDGKILDAHKPGMIKGGEWRAQNPKAPRGHRSYHLNSLYAPAITFASMMVNWLQASGSTHGLKKFIQGNLAEPWREDWANTDESEANELEGEHQRGDLVGDYRIIAADTQTDSFWFVVRGFDRDGKSYLVDCGQVASFGELDEKFTQHACHAGIIDCAGDRTAEIYEAVFKRRGQWFGSRGWNDLGQGQPYRMQMKDPFTGDTKGRAGRSKIRYLHINKGVYEDEMARLRSRQISGFYTFTDTPDVYYKQLFSTYWVKETTKSGHTKTVKKMKRNRGDHLWDCEIMARALSKFIGIARADRQPRAPTAMDEPKHKPKKPRASRSRSATGFW